MPSLPGFDLTVGSTAGGNAKTSPPNAMIRMLTIDSAVSKLT
jgi:hypothetical protein